MFKRWRWMFGIALVTLVGLAGAQAWGQAQPAQPQGPAQRQGPGQRPASRGHARPVIGTIASVSGSSFVVTTWANRSVTVQTTSATRVLTQQQAALTDLRSGDLVRILAAKAANNSVVAMRVSDTPAALAGARGGRGGQDRGGLWGGRGTMVMIAGPLTGSPSGGAVMVALPAGAPLPVAVPSTARLSRTVSLPVSGLAAGTHVEVFGTPVAGGGLTAVTIYVPGVPAR